MKKPSYFKNTIVYFIMALSAIILTTVILMILPFQELSAMAAFICAIFCGIYLRMLFGEKSRLNKFSFIDCNDYGIMVSFGKYSGTTEQEIVDSFESTVKDWSGIYSENKVRSYLKKEGLFWLYFEPMPINLTGYAKPLAGYTPLYSAEMHVGFKDGDNLKSTAFQHELGHVLQGGVTGVWNEAIHHKIAAENGIN